MPLALYFSCAGLIGRDEAHAQVPIGGHYRHLGQHLRPECPDFASGRARKPRTSPKGYYIKPGQFVIEFPGFSSLILTPMYDVEAKLAEKFCYVPGFGQHAFSETPAEISAVKPSRNSPETALKNTETARGERFQEVRELKEKGWGKVKTIEKVYQAKPGESKKYFEAEAEYLEFLTIIASEERIEVSPMPP